jgi:hypothetical protein
VSEVKTYIPRNTKVQALQFNSEEWERAQQWLGWAFFDEDEYDDYQVFAVRDRRGGAWKPLHDGDYIIFFGADFEVWPEHEFHGAYRLEEVPE